jgi:Flp pilus assembly pilin Flp
MRRPCPIWKKKGQALVEYALVLAFISVLAISVLISMGQGISGTYAEISRQLSLAGIGH